MLFSLLLSLTNAADACGMPINVDAVFPLSGEMELAPDALLQVRLSCEQLWEDPQFIVEQNGVEIEADVRSSSDGYRRSEEVFVEVDPVEELKPGSSILFLWTTLACVRQRLLLLLGNMVDARNS